MSLPNNDHWQPLDPYNLEALTAARLQLHHVAQLPAATGKYLLPSRPDDSHASLSWLPGHQALAGEPLPNGTRIALRPADATLAILHDSSIGASFAMANQTLDAALKWLRAMLNKEGLDGEQVSLKMHYEIPPHPLGEGRAFRLQGADLSGLSSYWHNAHLLLSDVCNRHPQTSPIRCWPHHFDIATLITVSASSDPEKAKTIGVGLSPGDEGYPMPYFYVTPWPYPEAKSLDGYDLASGGIWHTRGWIGAILTADRISTTKPGEQSSNTRAFMQSAISACSNLLD